MAELKEDDRVVSGSSITENVSNHYVYSEYIRAFQIEELAIVNKELVDIRHPLGSRERGWASAQLSKVKWVVGMLNPLHKGH